MLWKAQWICKGTCQWDTVVTFVQIRWRLEACFTTGRQKRWTFRIKNTKVQRKHFSRTKVSLVATGAFDRQRFPLLAMLSNWFHSIFSVQSVLVPVTLQDFYKRKSHYCNYLLGAKWKLNIFVFLYCYYYILTNCVLPLA